MQNPSLAETYVQKRFFSAAARRSAAKTGAAMPGGRYPIRNGKDLKNAVGLVGHSSDQGAVRAHIRSRAAALGLGDPFAKSAYSAEIALRLLRKDWAEYDAQRGPGEKTGRVGGLVTGIFAAPHVGRSVGQVLLRHGGSRGRAIGAGLVAGYGAIKGAQAVGGYVGRKIDETVGRVFKGSVEQTMHEYKHGKLRSGSKTGPRVTDRKQAIAIAMSQAGLSNR
jgi:hypothetical protein